LPSGLAASVRLKLVAAQFIQHLTLLPRHFIALELLLQPGLEFSQSVLQQITVPLQSQLMFVGLLQLNGADSARKLCSPQLGRGCTPFLDLQEVCLSAHDLLLNLLQRDVLAMLKAFAVGEDGGERELEWHTQQGSASIRFKVSSSVERSSGTCFKKPLICGKALMALSSTGSEPCW